MDYKYDVRCRFPTGKTKLKAHRTVQLVVNVLTYLLNAYFTQNIIS